MQKKIQKVMLINPSNTMPKDSVRRLATPLGLLYMGVVLKSEGYDVDILDSTCEGYYNTEINGDRITYGLSDEDIVKRIRDSSPDLVGVTSMFTAHQKNAIHHCNLVKIVNPELRVVLGGIHPSLEPEESILNDSVDFVILGEGEYRITNLIDCLNNNKMPDFDGITYKKNGQVIIRPRITRIQNLDKIPFPARELINMERYIDIGVPYAPFPRKERVEQIMTSRGCPFNCVFCSTKEHWGKKFRARSVENIIAEVDELVNKYGIQEIQFSDDNMTVNKERAKELFKKLKPYNLSWCTPHGLMAKTLDEEMIRLMAESGAYQLTFAIESGSERVLRDIIHKDVPSKNKIKHLVDECHSNGVQVHGMFVVGFPGETRKEINQTLSYPFDIGFESVSYFIANPLPGSDLYVQCKKKGYLAGQSGDFKTAEILISKNSPDYIMSPQELVELVDQKTREFNEFSKAKNPGAWDKKFDLFLQRHGDKADLILGRVT